MWECQQCGCKGIAADLVACPMCEEERKMPKSTTGGASNAWEETEAVVAEATEQPAEDAPVEAAPEPQDAPVTVVGEPGPELVAPPKPDAAPAPKKAAPKKSAAADPSPENGVQP
jgi:hypothetical protein